MVLVLADAHPLIPISTRLGRQSNMGAPTEYKMQSPITTASDRLSSSTGNEDLKLLSECRRVSPVLNNNGLIGLLIMVTGGPCDVD